MTTVSIALASYNGARFIEAQLRSFAEQIRPPDQVVIRDDGSTDDTAAIVARFAEGAPFPIDFAINPERRGYSRNFEGAVAATIGDLVFLSDQDDVWFADKIATVVAAFEASPDNQVFVNDQEMTDADLRPSGVTKLQNLAAIGQGAEGLIEGCCTAFRREWAAALLPMPAAAESLLARGTMSHDRWLNELASLAGLRGVVATPLQYFRRYGDNTTSWVLSEPRRTGLKDLVAQRVRTAPVAAWRERVAVLDLYTGWVAANRAVLEHLRGDVDAALGAVERERWAHLARCTLVTRGPIGRALAAANLLRQGGYHYFYGWKSAVRDLVRGA